MHSEPIISVAFNGNGTILASGSADYNIKLWNIATKTEITTFSTHTDRIHALEFSPNG